jgi:hypothetical protein
MSNFGRTWMPYFPGAHGLVRGTGFCATLIRPAQLLTSEIELDNFGVKFGDAEKAGDAGRRARPGPGEQVRFAIEILPT